jgi:DNA (cytosine-5)-methyltransferase 1
MFRFPTGFPLKLRLKDVLEDEVDEKYYLSSEQIKNACMRTTDSLIYDKSMVGVEGHAREYNDISPTLTARDYKEPRLVNTDKLKQLQVRQIGNLFPSKTRDNPNQGRLYDADGLSPTLGAMQGGNRQPFVMVDNSTDR